MYVTSATACRNVSTEPYSNFSCDPAANAFTARLLPYPEASLSPALSLSLCLSPLRHRHAVLLDDQLGGEWRLNRPATRVGAPERPAPSANLRSSAPPTPSRPPSIMAFRASNLQAGLEPERARPGSGAGSGQSTGGGTKGGLEENQPALGPLLTRRTCHFAPRITTPASAYQNKESVGQDLSPPYPGLGRVGERLREATKTKTKRKKKTCSPPPPPIRDSRDEIRGASVGEGRQRVSSEPFRRPLPMANSVFAHPPRRPSKSQAGETRPFGLPSQPAAESAVPPAAESFQPVDFASPRRSDAAAVAVDPGSRALAVRPSALAVRPSVRRSRARGIRPRGAGVVVARPPARPPAQGSGPPAASEPALAAMIGWAQSWMAR
ncbi:hypothetical protein CDD83_1067 [Cordyceps sp. RAO-2017]|nr:hypothetical protein CDD83_1067 [Cordyceps sp. RAO-2017]